ncbi:hypothetical protein EG68_02113 [Paragonimus skrjabini miyazakii]|uniref:Uncharacterized protein n=1 Tax=Paragonimus skrjabini miyazakii TaxID=59628 RepID=A0A8S9ZAZ4_9TREM|nr:hypothetical protein EG68_02113 [Paragonimus skrjabini miyazakii]
MLLTYLREKQLIVSRKISVGENGMVHRINKHFEIDGRNFTRLSSNPTQPNVLHFHLSNTSLSGGLVKNILNVIHNAN